MGKREYRIYSVTSDWSDTSRIDPQLFGYPHDLDESISVTSVTSDTTSTLATLEFEIDINELFSWSGDKSFLVTNTVFGESMVNLYSDNSTRSPAIEFITEYSNGLIDTTSIKSKEGTY